MNLKTEKPLLFWCIFLTLLSCALIGQSAFLPAGGQYNWGPYLIWPPMVFFFLYHNSISSLLLLSFMSVLSSIFFSLSTLSVFFLYLFCFVTVFSIKTFFFSKSSLLFFILVFLISFFFPYLADLAYDFSINDLSLAASLFYFSKAFATLILSFLLFPFLKKHLQDNSGF